LVGGKGLEPLTPSV